MADTTDVTQQTNAGGNVNTPASGTYGEAASLDRLKAALPTPPGAGPGSSSGHPAPMPVPQPSGIARPPQGLPQAMFAPTKRPDVPVSTPLPAAPVNPMAAAQTQRQKNLALVDALVNDPSTSEGTRQWAQMVRDRLIQGSRG